MRKKLPLAAGVALLGLLLAATAGAAEPVHFRNLRGGINLGPRMDIFEDRTGKATIGEIVGPAAERFQPSQSETPNRGITTSAVWVRFTLVNDGPDPVRTLLAYGLPLMEDIDIYLWRDGKQVEREVGGIAVPVSKRAYKHRNQAFPLTLPPQTPTTVYIRFETTAMMVLDLSLWNPSDFDHADKGLQYLMGADVGLLAALALYNFWLFLSLGDRRYLYYLLFLGAFGLHQLSLIGFAGEILWPESPRWTVWAPLFFAGLTIFTGLQFTRSFLNIRSYSQALDRMYLILMGLGLAAAGWTFIDATTANYFSGVTLFLAIFAICESAVVSWMQGNTAARFLLFAWGLFFVCSGVTAATVLGLLPYSRSAMEGAQYGWCLSAIALSFAVGDRITMLNRKHRRDMETVIARRTRELNQMVDRLQIEVRSHEKTEQALQISELKYRQLVESVTDIIFETDAQGNFIYINPVAVRTIGAPHERIIGTHFLAFVRDDYRKKVGYFYQQQAKNRLADTYLEFPIVTPVGREIWVGQNLHLVTEAGEVVGGRGVARDVTARVKVEQDLSRERALFELFMENIPDHIYFKDLDSKFLRVNRAQATWLGLDNPQKAVGRTDADFFTDEHAAAARRDEQAVIRSGQPVIREAEKETWPGRRVTWAATAKFPLLDAEGRVAGTFGISRDVTDRKEAADRLRESEQRYRLLADNSNDIIWTMDMDFRFTYISPSVERLRGFTVEEAMAQSLEEALAPASVEVALNVFAEELLLEGTAGADPLRSRILELEQTCKDGSTIWSEANVAFLRDENRRAIGLIGATRDISDRKRMAIEIVRAKEAAEAASRAKSEFLANMSHELRTPLNSIIGFSEMLELQHFGALGDKQRQYVQRIYSSGHHLLQLINDILDLSKVEAGKMELELSRVEIPRLLETSLLMIKEKAAMRGVAVELQLDSSAAGLRLDADERKLKQILFNLLSNAVKFTNDNGSVAVEARRVGHELIVAVADTGVGIAPANLERIFEEFVQIKGEGRRERQGAGLGLALTRKLVGMHGGLIWAESEGLGLGSRFTFTVPIRPAAGEPAEPPFAEATPGPPRERPAASRQRQQPLALVVEDDPNAAELLTQYLTDGGYSVAQAFDADEALRAAAKLRPDAITLDIQLGSKDGLQTLAELKMRAECRDIPVVIVSVTEKQQLAFALGAMAWLVKPVDKHQLLDVLETLRGFDGRAAKVLIVDDDRAAVEMLATHVVARGFQALQAYDGRQGVDMALALQPDVMVLDLVLPKLNGFEVVAALQNHPVACEIPIIVFTAKELDPREAQRLYSHVKSIAPKSDKDRLLQELDRICRAKFTTA